jgi:hypothetical protein
LTLAVAGSLALAGCGGSPSTSTTSSTTTTTGSTTTTVVQASCANAVASTPVRSQLVVADGRSGAELVPGTVFYGTCGATRYAVARFEPTEDASVSEEVQFQDHGAYPEFFTSPVGGAWQLVGSQSGPPGAMSCTDFTSAPSKLRALWDDCVTSVTTTTLNSDCESFAEGQFLEALSVTAHADGTVSVEGHPVMVHCGGPDDMHYLPQARQERVTLRSGATIEILSPSFALEPATASQLQASIALDDDGNIYKVTGPLGAASALTAEFHP